MKFVVVPLPGRRWLWELRKKDGSVVCRSARVWTDRADVMVAIEAVRSNATKAKVFDPLGSVLATHAPHGASTASNKLVNFPG